MSLDAIVPLNVVCTVHSFALSVRLIVSSMGFHARSYRASQKSIAMFTGARSLPDPRSVHPSADSSTVTSSMPVSTPRTNTRNVCDAVACAASVLHAGNHDERRNNGK